MPDEKITVGVLRSLGFVLVRRLLGLLGLGPAPDAKDVEIGDKPYGADKPDAGGPGRMV